MLSSTPSPTLPAAHTTKESVSSGGHPRVPLEGHSGRFSIRWAAQLNNAQLHGHHKCKPAQ